MSESRTRSTLWPIAVAFQLSLSTYDARYPLQPWNAGLSSLGHHESSMIRGAVGVTWLARKVVEAFIILGPATGGCHVGVLN